MESPLDFFLALLDLFFLFQENIGLYRPAIEEQSHCMDPAIRKNVFAL